MKLGFTVSYALRGTGSGKSILLLWIMAEVILFRSQELDSSFLIFGEAQDLESVYGDKFSILPDLGKGSNSFYG